MRKREFFNDNIFAIQKFNHRFSFSVLVQRELEFSLYWDSLNLKTQTGKLNA